VSFSLAVAALCTSLSAASSLFHRDGQRRTHARTSGRSQCPVLINILPWMDVEVVNLGIYARKAPTAHMAKNTITTAPDPDPIKPSRLEFGFKFAHISQ
jgi:hypothetical protein